MTIEAVKPMKSALPIDASVAASFRAATLVLF